MRKVGMRILIKGAKYCATQHHPGYNVMSLVIGSDHLEDHAPRWRTLSRTTDFDQLGHHDLPLIGGLCLVQRTSPAGQHDLPLIGGLCRVQRTSPAGQHDLQQDRA